MICLFFKITKIYELSFKYGWTIIIIKDVPYNHTWICFWRTFGNIWIQICCCISIKTKLPYILSYQFLEVF